MINSLNFNKDKSETKIVVAMSGGVDSSVVACLLKEQGYDVIGITLQLYDMKEVLKKKKACCAGTDIYDAKKVAQKMNFDHYILNYQNLFKESVIDDFADSYLQGQTPIPCVKCNQSVKFRDLLKVAKDLGADALATGHYVQKIIGDDGKSQLLKATDNAKDQSYFLFATTQDQLNFLSFPLGANTKEETRKEAERLGLEIADKPDSQDICFVPNGDYAKVIENYRPKAFKAGDFIHIKTKENLGKHSGIINFTLGQRRGLGVSYSHPLYVIKIDPKENIVYLGEEEFLQNQKFTIREVNWLGDEFEKSHKFLTKVRLRSTHEEEDAEIKLYKNNKEILGEVTMKSQTRAITPGQACVFYDKERVLGGGWIDKVIEN
jgi:tRNA-specific 2-thiouridylase